LALIGRRLGTRGFEKRRGYKQQWNAES